MNTRANRSPRLMERVNNAATEDEIELLRNYHAMNEEGQSALLGIATGLVLSKRYLRTQPLHLVDMENE